MNVHLTSRHEAALRRDKLRQSFRGRAGGNLPGQKSEARASFSVARGGSSGPIEVYGKTAASGWSVVHGGTMKVDGMRGRRIHRISLTVPGRYRPEQQ